MPIVKIQVLEELFRNGVCHDCLVYMSTIHPYSPLLSGWKQESSTMETRLTPRIAAMMIGGLEQTVNRRRCRKQG